MIISARWIRFIAAVVVLSAAPAASIVAEGQPLGNILILNSYHPGFSWSDEEEAGIIDQLKSEIPSMNILVEYLDTKHFSQSSHLVRMKNFLIDKYQGKKIDLIFALDDAAVKMLTEDYQALFPGVPVIFAGISEFNKYASNGRHHITGVLETQDIRRTIDTALSLQPDTTEILAINDMTISGITARKALQAIIPSYAGRVTIRFLPECTFEEARATVAALPENSIILLNTYSVDSTGKTLSTKNSSHIIVSAAKVPVYGVHENRFGDGIIGGYLLSGREQGKRAAKIGVRVLAGEDPASIAIEETGTSVPMFDYNQMKRFNIPISKLPEKSIIINRPMSVFTTHREFAITITVILILLGVAVSMLTFFIIRLLQARAALKRKTEELDRIFTLSLDLLCVINLDGRLIRLNPAWQNTLGYSLAELKEKRFIDLVHPEDIAVTKSVFKRATGKAVVDFVNRYQCKSGSYRWIEWRSTPYKGSFIYAAARDITERKRIEQSLRESENFQRALLQTIPDLIWLKDPNGVYLTCNTMFERLFNSKEEEIIGKTDYDFVDKAQADFFREHDCNAIAAGKPTNNEEWVTFASDGRRTLLDTTKTPMVDHQGELIGVLGIARDITERRKIEEEKTNLKSQLQQAQKMESVGRLAGGVAHDFNNMLAVILGYGELALEQTGPDHQLHDALQEIMKAARHSAEITRQLLAFARKQTVSPKVINLNSVVETMTGMLRRLIGEDIDLAWLPDGSVWPVKIDPGQIDQILINLCINARDAIPGSGKVTIETGNARFDTIYCDRHPGYPPGEYALLAVSDNGSGMDAETLGNIFEPFFTTKDSGKGTGLGLATVFGIVKQNHGFINAYSEPNQGTTFKIYLPRQMAGETYSPAKIMEQPVESGHETILLVEDEPALLRMTTKMLKKLNYTVIAFRTPAEAIRMAQEHEGPIHMLMTDVILPEMNGRDLSRTILSILPGIKCLFMSGYTANVIAHHGVLDEGVEFMQKPFSITQLGPRLRELLNKNKL